MQPLLAAPRQGLTEAQVLSAINGPSPSVRHGVDVLNGSLQPVAGETLPIDPESGGAVIWDYRPEGGGATDTVEVRRRCELTLAGPVSDAVLLSRLFRVWVEMRATDGTWIRFNQGVFVSTLPGQDDDGTVIRRRLTLAPREHLFASRSLSDGVTVTATEDVLAHIRNDLSTVFGITATAFPAPSGGSTLGVSLFCPTGTSYAEKWRRMLAGIAYDQVVTTPDGIPTAQALATLAGKGPEWRYAPGDGRVVVAGSVEPLSPELPNVVRFEARNGPSLGATEGNGLYTRRNQSDGPGSINQRGYEVFRSVQVDATTQAELVAFGNAEFQRLVAGGGLRWAGRVGWNPLHDERDVIGIVRPRMGLSGVWQVTSWRLPLARVDSEGAVLMDLTAELRVTAS